MSQAAATSRSSTSACRTAAGALRCRRPPGGRAQVVQPLPGPLELGLGVVPRRGVRAVEHQRAHDRALRAREQVADEDQVAGRLGHLLPIEPHGADVEPRSGERRDAGRRLGLGGLERVVREAQVLTTGVQVQRGPVGRQRHGGALGVPARPARSPRRGPGRLVGPADLPDGLVERVVLGRVVRPPAVGGELRVRLLGGQPGGDADVRAAEVDAAGALVRRPRLEQRRGELDDLRHEAVRAWLVRRPPHAERGHVLLEVELLDGGEAVGVSALAGGSVVQHVVDVGDVAAHLGVHPEPAQHPVGDVDPHEGRGVAQVRHVVRRDPADVDAGPADDRHRHSLEPQAVWDGQVGHGGSSSLG